MHKPKILFFDIDGTLIDMQKKCITPLMLSTLHKLQANGIRLAIATGRSPMTVPLEEFPGVQFDVFITFNGSYCYDKDRVLFASPIPTEDIRTLRRALEQAGAGQIRIFAKIESLAGVQALPEFLPLVDEVVIARGDLGNSMPLWELPRCQKQLSAVCRSAGVPFMVVTQMLDSMCSRAVPTRAEVSDIYNAVLDGAASLMLTGETAAGQYPVQAMEYLVKTAQTAL